MKREKYTMQTQTFVLILVKAALPDNETVPLEFGNDGVNDTLLIYFSISAHVNKN